MPTIHPAPPTKKLLRKQFAQSEQSGPSVEVTIQYLKGMPHKPPPAIIRQAVRRTVKALGFLPACSIAVFLADDATLAGLNRRFRKIIRPTDVLSFSAGGIDPMTGHIYLGDLVISIPRGISQARAHKHTLEEEIRLLAVHGTLHLFGYDHDTLARKRRMWAEQEAILGSFEKTAAPRGKRGG
jgi:probable rRNA maturation factor